MGAITSTAPYSIGSILTTAWQHFRMHLRTIVLITLIVYIPVNIVLSFVPFDALFAKEGGLFALRAYWRAVELLEGAIGIIASMAIAFVVVAGKEGKTLEAGDALRQALARWWAAIGTNILAGLAALGLALLLIFPAVIYAVYWMFVLYVVALRGLSGRRALAYSKRMVKGRWWMAFGYGAAFGILGLLVSIVASAPSWFLPDQQVIEIASNTFIDVVSAYFVVVNVILFLEFDRTTQRDTKDANAAA